MIETKFSQFLRTGGHGECFLSGSRGRRIFMLGRKNGFPGYEDLRHTFEKNLDRADLINRDLLTRFIRNAVSPTTPTASPADISGYRAAALESWEGKILAIHDEWGARPDRFHSIRRSMEDGLVIAFSGLINEARQRALGIDSYVWRSRGDDKVRHLHADYDGQAFDWENPPDDGHPGQAYNCRCFAEPLLIDEPDWAPDLGPGYILGRVGAETEGIWSAVSDFAGEVFTSIAEIPAHLYAAGRYAVLAYGEARGTLSQEEMAEFQAMRAKIDAGLQSIEYALRNAPEIAAAAIAYLNAVEARPALMDQAYRNGLATEAQVQEAFKDRAYLETLILLNVVPVGMLAQMMRRRGLIADPGDLGKLREALLAEAARSRRLPTDVDWATVSIPSIRWGGPIKEQGGPWEDALERMGHLGERLPPTFQTFDFFDRASMIATSAKTLDTRAWGYVTRPSRIYGQLRRYIDQIDSFNGSSNHQPLVNQTRISGRRLELAVPRETSPEQITQIQRAIEYAESRGIEVTVRFIE
jgi:SPP1 gp7 family putative phage head morphogenesis protein